MSNLNDLYSVSNDEIAVLRKKFLYHTSNNLCAAFLLDQFVAVIAIRGEYSRRNNGEYLQETSSDVEWSIEGLRNDLFGLYTLEEVCESLNLLVNRRYITNNGLVKGTSDTYNITVNQRRIDEVTKEYTGNVPDPTPPFLPYTPISDGERAELAKDNPLWAYSVEPQVYTASSPKRSGQSKKIEHNNRRARSVGLPATLNIAQWNQTLEDFNHLCAFCSTGKYQVLEHFIPIACGGGTTEYNCIPSCSTCNRIKHDTHPDTIPANSVLAAALPKIREYLEARRLSEVVEEVER